MNSGYWSLPRFQCINYNQPKHQDLSTVRECDLCNMMLKSGIVVFPKRVDGITLCAQDSDRTGKCFCDIQIAPISWEPTQRPEKQFVFCSQLIPPEIRIEDSSRGSQNGFSVLECHGPGFGDPSSPQ